MDISDVKAGPYEVRFNGETSFNSQIDPEINNLFLKCQERWFNDKLQTVGYIFLNDVLLELGLKRIPEGQIVGWCLLVNPSSFVDFGLHDKKPLGKEDVITLNVDGVIWDKI